MDKKLRIIFMGTPEFAVASLSALVDADFNIACVITAPDKPAGRGMRMNESAVKKYAVEKGLKILQPEKLKNSAFIEELKKIDAEVQVVVAFRMLPEVVWKMPPLGTINVHASLLPQYRGAAPINWAIINGEKQTGVTTFKLQHEIDMGNILLQEIIPIDEDETAGELHDKMKESGARILVKTIQQLGIGKLDEIPQENISPVIKHAPKIFTETCKIHWNKTAEEIHNLIRGLSPFPGAFTFLNEKILKIYKSSKEIASHNFKNGHIQTDNKTFLKFACRDGFIKINELQIEGKRRMLIEDFLKGYQILKNNT
ncbi:MAG: methionyl-tRNA formyltransferase [Panacibacter sp.]